MLKQFEVEEGMRDERYRDLDGNNKNVPECTRLLWVYINMSNKCFESQFEVCLLCRPQIHHAFFRKSLLKTTVENVWNYTYDLLSSGIAFEHFHLRIINGWQT